MFDVTVYSVIDILSLFVVSVFMVTEEEWSQIERFFKVDTDIVVTRNRASTPSFSEAVFSSSPSVCEECVKKRHEDEEKERLRYRDVPVYVRQLTDKQPRPNAQQDASDPDFQAAAATGGGVEGGGGAGGSDTHASERPGTPVVTSTSTTTSSQNGAVGSSVSCGSKRQKTDPAVGAGGDGFATPSPLPNGNADNSGFIRRSNRRQKVRGDREIVVSSDMRLKNFKVKVSTPAGTASRCEAAPPIYPSRSFPDHGAVQGCPLRPAPLPPERRAADGLGQDTGRAEGASALPHLPPGGRARRGLRRRRRRGQRHQRRRLRGAVVGLAPGGGIQRDGTTQRILSAKPGAYWK